MQLSLDLTDRCNLSCSYCFKKQQNKAYKELSVEDIKAIYDKYEPKMMRFFGGEPTLRWNDILEFLDYACPKMKGSQYVLIITNGTTGIDFETIPKEYRNRVFIGFSLDGFEEINDKNRGKGSYKKTHDAIIRCLNAGISASIATTRTTEDYFNNLDEFKNFVNYYINEVKVSIIGAGCTVSLNNYNCNNKDLFIKMIDSIANELSNPNSLIAEHSYFPCKEQIIRIHTDGYINPRCAILNTPIIGHWTQWSKDNLIKLLDYCNKSCYDCQSKNALDIKRFADGLIKIEGCEI